MIDLGPPPVVIPVPAIVQRRALVPVRFIWQTAAGTVELPNGLPRDFLEMPAEERWRLDPKELLPYLPEPFRHVPPALLAGIPGFPGPISAAGLPKVKTVVLLTGGATWKVLSDWNKRDNIVWGVAAGGDGANGTHPGGFANGGGGGGGGGFSGISNVTLTRKASIAISVGAGDTWLKDITTLLAKAGTSGSGRTAGTGGLASGGVGTLKYSGANGAAGDFDSSNATGGIGGGAAGPQGDGVGFYANSGAGHDGDWYPAVAPGEVDSGANSGNGGNAGFGSPTAGGDGKPFGGGGGGGGASSTVGRSGGSRAPGCLLAVNNPSL